MVLVELVQAAIVLQPGDRRRIGGVPCQPLGLIEQRLRVRILSLIGQLQRHQHHRVGGVGIVGAECLLLQGEGGTEGTLRRDRTAGQVGTGTGGHQVLVLADIARFRRLRGEARRQ